MAFHRWMYRGGHPNWVAKSMNRFWAWFHALGLLPNSLVTLEVPGRKSGKIIRFPLALTVLDGQRYLVSMLGEDVNWIRNVRAAGDKATLVHGLREEIMLVPVEASLRAPILKAYLKHAPGARPHIPVSPDAPLEEFAAVAADIPVFRVEPRAAGA